MPRTFGYSNVIASPTFTGVALFADGTVGAPSISFTSDPDTGLWKRTTNVLTFTCGGVDGSEMQSNSLAVGSTFSVKWGDATTISAITAFDLFANRVSAGILQVHGSSTAVGATIRRIGGNVGAVDWGSVSENLTLSTGGTTTDTTANLLPANSYIDAVTCRITTTIATATDWRVGDATTAGRFTAANATLTAGTTSVGLVHCDVTGAGGPRQTAAAKIRVTTTGTPSAGAIRLTSYYNTFVAPTS